MIWIDSSFLIEWFLGQERAAKIRLPKPPWKILDLQYAEIIAFFLRKGHGLEEIVQQLEPLELQRPQKSQLHLGCKLFATARHHSRSKVSLADAILAAAVILNKGRLLSFDQDFAQLGLCKSEGFWEPASANSSPSR